MTTPVGFGETDRTVEREPDKHLCAVNLRSIEPHASKGPKGSYLTLQLGIGLTERTIDWCKATERQLAAETERELD